MSDSTTEALFDAVVLAGDRRASRSVLGRNKSLLEVHHTPLVIHVLRALTRVRRVRRIFLVGPEADLRRALAAGAASLDPRVPIEIIEQLENVYQNFWAAFTRSIDHYREGLELEDPAVRDKAMLIVPCDTPLITTAELDEFLDKSPLDRLDYCLGMTEEHDLRKFYPAPGKPGIRMSYLHLREGSYRMNNLHLLRPFRIDNRTYIEELYEHRYQKQFGNIVKLAWDFLRTEGFGWRGVRLYALLQLCVFLSYANLRGPLRALRQRLTLEEASHFACVLLKTRIGIVETRLGGCAADIDNAADFAAMEARFGEWSALLGQTPRAGGSGTDG